MSVSQCSPCGREFSSLTAFDRHQDVDYDRKPRVICRDPKSAGLVLNSAGRWACPGNRPVPASGDETEQVSGAPVGDDRGAGLDG